MGGKNGKNERPNLLFILADQLRLSSCGYAGCEQARAPRIDRFAEESVDFTNAVSGYPVCGPYRNSLFTGKYPSSTGMVINELRCMPDPEAFGHTLRREGYDSSYIGKWHLYGRNHSDVEQFTPPGPYRLGFDGYWAAFNFNHRYYNGFYYEDAFEKRLVDGFEPDVHTEMAIQRLQAHRESGGPFALFLNYGTPHDPWSWDNVPKEWGDLFREVEFGYPETYADGSAEYWAPKMTAEWWLQNVKPKIPEWQKVYHAMTANLDWNVGRVLDALDALGLAETTIVAFTSDHGEMFGAHGRLAKKIFYEEAVRVPFLLRQPGRIPEGSSSDACLNAPDIMPTLLGLMEIPVPSSAEGMDLSAAALGKPGPEPEAAFMQGMGHTFQWRDGDEWRALRGKRHTYAVMRADRSEYLFDNENDPLQQQNLADAPASRELLERFRAQLTRRMAELGDTFEATTAYRDMWTQDRRIVRSATRQMDGKTDGADSG